jgi:Protein of unknown function (DUF1761)
MNAISFNWVGMSVCLVAGVIIQYLWYCLAGLRAQQKGTDGPEKQPATASALTYVIAFGATFVETVFVSALLKVSGSLTPLTGAMTGLMIWFGLVGSTNLVNNVFAGRGWKVWGIEAGYHLVYLLACGAILGTWQ